MNQAFTKILRKHAVFLVLALIVGAFQTTFWPFLTGLKTAPQLWLIFITYFVLTRDLQPAVIISYFYGFVFSAFSVHPAGYFFLALLATTVAVSFLRNRLLGPGGTYVIASTVGVVVLWHLSTWLITWFVDVHPSPVMLLTRAFEVVLTIPFTGAIFAVLKYFDLPVDRPSVLASLAKGKGDE